MQDCYDLLEDANDGIFRWGSNEKIEGAIQGELICETYLGASSIRIFRFWDDGAQKHWYMHAWKMTRGLKCPSCENEMHVLNENDEQEHDDDCEFMFNQAELIKANHEYNRDYNNWVWNDGRAVYSIERSLLEVFFNGGEFPMKITKTKPFKDFQKYLETLEKKEFKKIYPKEYEEEIEHEKMMKKIDREFFKDKKQNKCL